MAGAWRRVVALLLQDFDKAVYNISRDRRTGRRGRNHAQEKESHDFKSRCLCEGRMKASHLVIYLPLFETRFHSRNRMHVVNTTLSN